MKISWPVGPYYWNKGQTQYISIPFTWNLPEVKSELSKGFRLYKKTIIGGPAINMMPGYFNNLGFVEEGKNCPGVLQKINPFATRTTTGCIRKCKFCAIGTGKIEPGGLVELDNWPNLPIIIDNNLLAASRSHFDKVIDILLSKWNWADFNQGIDPRLLKDYHARRFAEIKKPTIRLALDSLSNKDIWNAAFEILRSAKIAKANIRSYALIGFDSGPEEAWLRCEWIEKQGALALPMWFHELDSMKTGAITNKQKEFGWNWQEYRGIMAWYYHHKDLGIRKKYI